MQIVIDIPEEIYESQRYAQYFGAWSVVLQKHFENGTPIPDNATNGDAISREAVLKEFEKGTENLYGRIDALPSVQPSRKGHWIDISNFVYECSNCGGRGMFRELFCPNCGADMRGDTE